MYDPESKGKVERGTKYLCKDFFYGHPIVVFETLNSKAHKWCDEVRFITAQDLTGQLHASLAHGTFQRELERFGKHHLLIINKLRFLSLDKTASNHFFLVINQAYEHQPVIITSNRPF